MDKYREIKDRFVVHMTDLRINLHPNHSYALYVQPGRSHDIYQDVHKVIPGTESRYIVPLEIPATETLIFEDELIRQLSIQPKALPSRWVARDPAFAVKAFIAWMGSSVRHEPKLVWIGHDDILNTIDSNTSIGLKASGDKLTIRNVGSVNIRLEFLLGVHYPITVVPCVLKQAPDLFNVQDEFGPDAGELFISQPDKIPYTVTLTTTYLDRAGLVPLHDDWLIINGIRYVISRIRPINRTFRTAQVLPSVFSALVYPENEPEYLLDGKQPMDFIQVTDAVLREGKLTVLIASGVLLTHYRYYNSYPEEEIQDIPLWRELKEAYYFRIEPTIQDIIKGQVLLGFQTHDGKEIKRVIPFQKEPAIN